jgi:TolB protein
MTQRLRRRRDGGTLILVLLALLLIGVAILVVSLLVQGRKASPAGVALTAPAGASEDAIAALRDAGYVPAAAPVWTARDATWRTPGAYRLYFVAETPAGVDLFAAYVSLDAGGRVARLAAPARLTDTPDGVESAPAAAGDWLAYATAAGGYYQSIACRSLRNDAVHTFILDEPAANLILDWAADGRLTAETNSGARWLIAPANGQVTPTGGLTYAPAQRGEMPFLPRMVSRIRELPGVGPEKIAFLENVFFTLVDYANRLWHGIAGRNEPAGPTAIVSAPTPTAPAPTETPAPTPQPPTATPPRTEKTEATTAPARANSPMPAPSPSATATATRTPTPLGRTLKDGVVWRGSVQPDGQRPYAFAEIVDLDPAQLQIKMIPGSMEPKPTTGLIGSGVIPTEDWPALVAAFNGGFAAMHGRFGMMVERKVYLPARDGIATLAVYEDGSIRMGTWGKDLKQTPDMVSYRQNCPPLIENGVITAETGKLTLWGLSVANEVYLYRSGLGVTAEGKLVYVAGKPLSAYTLARALQMAGAVYAMQLDVDEYHVVFVTYDVTPAKSGGAPAVAGQKLRADMHGYDNFFLTPFQLDFFYLTRRSEPLADALRRAPTPAAGAAAPTPMYASLPGRIAFASTRDGNWEIYAMPADTSAAARRLTDHPGDDLYPVWSPDGRQIAFASRRDGDAEIYTLDLAGAAPRRITRLPSEEWAPAWSPDGATLIYQSDRNGQSDVYAARPDGSGETRLTTAVGNHEAPHWSPDGKRIVFDSDLDVNEDVHASINLYIMNADGSNPRRIFDGAESPAWSPDGQKIAFTPIWGGRWQVVVINADGTGARQLTVGAYDARYPAWSPDGKWIAFAGNETGHWELYVLPAGGGPPQRLTYGTSDSSYPAWGF